MRVVTVAAAFLFGLLIDRIGGESSINLLAPPVFALVVWNLLVTSGCSCARSC
ncbi:hypothetical protein [Agromyces ramosus]|uniref:Rod shape-determining protein MreD n=1 Tax=Agromyces ramosus TaxID=33879 RepID=A0ABU0R5Y7_9MICO|nr:hypothetical protein [Agromyces ramosus]MDQ0893494.1 hypothetical protein [Agromyces ramosus]